MVVDVRCRFLLLDVRERDEYDEAHIVGAVSYPQSMIARGSNELLPGAGSVLRRSVSGPPSRCHGSVAPRCLGFLLDQRSFISHV